MKNQEMEQKLNNAENFLYEIGKMADEIKGKYEFAADKTRFEKIKKLANDAQQEITEAKAKNQ